jgi:hypothetical protein
MHMWKLVVYEKLYFLQYISGHYIAKEKTIHVGTKRESLLHKKEMTQNMNWE